MRDWLNLPEDETPISRARRVRRFLGILYWLLTIVFAGLANATGRTHEKELSTEDFKEEIFTQAGTITLAFQ